MLSCGGMPSTRRVLAVLLAAACLAGGARRWRASLARAAETVSDEDGRAYHSAALNLARRGTLSLDPPFEEGPRAPSLRRGPLFPAVLAPFAAGAAPGDAAFFWRVQGASGLAHALLGAALGVAAAGPLAGLAAGAAAALDPLSLQHAATLNVQLFFASLVALVGLALLRWGRAPTPANAGLAGLAVGATLLTRSTLTPFLAFLPAWLALGPRPRRWPAQLAAFWGAAFACLLPWLMRNRLLMGRTQAVEPGIVEYFIVAGASGTVSDDFPEAHAQPAGAFSMADPRRERRGPLAAVAEAGRLFAAAPLPALTAFAARAGFWGWGLLAWVPALLVLRAARREDPALWGLGGLAVYWNIHLLAFTAARHFIPAMAPLSALAASGFAMRRAALPPPLSRALDALPWLSLLLVAAAWAALGRELSASPRAGAVQARLDAAAAALEDGRPVEARKRLENLERGPLVDWQARELARLYQRLGEHAACERLFSALAGLYPRSARLHNDAAVCALLGGRVGSGEASARAALEADPAFLPAALTLGSVLEARGRRPQAAELYGRALAASTLPPEDGLRRAVMDARLAALGRPRGRR